jgi:hypothetical protein
MTTPAIRLIQRMASGTDALAKEGDAAAQQQPPERRAAEDAGHNQYGRTVVVLL